MVAADLAAPAPQQLGFDRQGPGLAAPVERHVQTGERLSGSDAEPRGYEPLDPLHHDGKRSGDANDRLDEIRPRLDELPHSTDKYSLKVEYAVGPYGKCDTIIPSAMPECS